MKVRKTVVAAVIVLMLCGVVHAGKPVALMGFGTDVNVMKFDVVDRNRYVCETFIDGWVEPSDYCKYSVLYFGEKLRGKAKGKNWLDGEVRAAAERFIAEGGTVIVAGKAAMVELLGKFVKGKADFLREKVVFIPESLGRLKIGYARANKPLSFADSAGNDILTDEGRKVAELQEKFMAAFQKANDIEKLPELEKWEGVPLGEKGFLKLPDRFPKRPKLGKPVKRKEGLLLWDGKTKADRKSVV